MVPFVASVVNAVAFVAAAPVVVVLATAAETGSPLALIVSLWGGSATPLLLEHRTQLSQSLLSLPPGRFSVTSHEQLLELLKARFGEGDNAMLDAIIMLSLIHISEPTRPY